jgi:hypothetical protein
MSGGHFDYQQHHIEDIAEHLEKDIVDVEFAKEIGKVKKKQLYCYLVDTDSGSKYWPYWLMEMSNRYKTRDEFVKSLRKRSDISERDGKFFSNDNYGRYDGRYEVVVYERDHEEWADGNWYHEFEDPEILEEFKKGLKILRTAAIYAQRIDWLLSGDDGEQSFKERLKEELDELESKPLIDYDYWKKIKEEDNRN